MPRRGGSVPSTARSSAYGYSLWEFSIYGTGGNPTSPPAQPADPVFPATRLVFSDEFNGPAGSKPDTAKWTYDPGVPQNGEVQYYTPNSENASMNGSGSLVIELRAHWITGLRPDASAYGALAYLASTLQLEIVAAVVIIGFYVVARVLAGRLGAVHRVTFDVFILLTYYAIGQGLLGLLLVHGFPRMVI